MTNSGTQVANRQAGRGSLLSRLRSYLFFTPAIYLYTGVLGTLSLLSSLSDRKGRVQHWFARTWARMILKTARVRVRVEGLDHISPRQTAIYAANHLSALDIPVLYASLPVQFRIMAKKELFRYPFLGWHLKRSGQIPIDAGDARTSLRSLSHASESLRHGTPLMVFPEGGRSVTGHIQEFMGGAAYVAIRAQAPIVPIALVGTDGALPMNSFHLLPGEVEMIIGGPIPTTGLRVRDMDKVTMQLRQAIAEMYYSRSKTAPAMQAGGETRTQPLLAPTSELQRKEPT
jgi:1-acyl-sn-glycerol-3-phosphate acyltransferase